MELQNLLNKIESLKQELDGYQPLPAGIQEKLDKKFRLEFNYNSNHIEGNTLTYGETELYLIFDKTTGDHEGREYDEMKGSDVALKLVQEYAADKERPLNETFIKNLNKTILVRPYWSNNAVTPSGQPTNKLITIGDYKQLPNSVLLQNGEIFHYASPQETPALMNDLVEWYRNETGKKELHPVVIAALLHYKFVRIHPFDDGNGRISRLLMNYVLYANGLPPVIIKSADKKSYLFALNKADTGDVDAFVEYIANQLLWSLELSIKAAKGEEIEENSDVEKKVELWKRELRSKNITSAITKSGDGIQKLYLENIKPFIELFQQKISSSFGDLFNNLAVSGKINETNEVDEYYADVIMSGRHLAVILDGVYKYQLQTTLQYYKQNKKNHFSIIIDFGIDFNDKNYLVKVSINNGFLQYYPDEGKLYNQYLNEEEQQIIIKDAINSIFNYIKENTEQ